jgi:hypothetical protein
LLFPEVLVLELRAYTHSTSPFFLKVFFPPLGPPSPRVPLLSKQQAYGGLMSAEAPAGPHPLGKPVYFPEEEDRSIDLSCTQRPRIEQPGWGLFFCCWDIVRSRHQSTEWRLWQQRLLGSGCHWHVSQAGVSSINSSSLLVGGKGETNKLQPCSI